MRASTTRPKRTFPVFVAREDSSSVLGCGHQHSLPGTARNCADNQERRTLRTWRVYKVDKDGSQSEVRS